MTTVENLFAAVSHALHDTGGEEKVALVRGLVDRLNRYADTLDASPFAEAGLDVMRGIFDVVADRETVPHTTIEQISPADVQRLYEAYVGPAVDGIEDHLLAD